MSKRSSDGDVLTNKVNVGLAKGNRLLASMLGPKAELESVIGKLERGTEHGDLEEEVFGPDRCVLYVFLIQPELILCKPGNRRPNPTADPTRQFHTASFYIK